MMVTSGAALLDDVPQDRTYTPPKRARAEPSVPVQIFNENGREIIETAESETEVNSHACEVC